MYVRRGNLGDIPWIIEQLKEFQLFFGSKRSLYHSEHSITRLESFMENGLVFVAEKETIGRVGFIVGAITPHLFNPTLKVLAELLWWVDPIHRKSRAGYLLLKEFIDWGKKNVDWMTFSLQENTPVKEETLKRFGFRLLERAFLIEMGCDYGSSSNSNSGRTASQ